VWAGEHGDVQLQTSVMETLRQVGVEGQKDQFTRPVSFLAWVGGVAFPVKKQIKDATALTAAMAQTTGLLKYGWVEKHLSFIPSVFVMVTQFNVDWSPQEWSKREGELRTTIDSVRVPLAGREAKVLLVACRPAGAVSRAHPDVLEERVTSMKKHLGLDPKHIMVWGPEDLTPVSSNAVKLSAMVKHMSTAYYELHLKRFKANERGVARSSNTGLQIRYNFKCGAFTELTLPPAKAVKYYAQTLKLALEMVRDRQFDEEVLGQLKYVLHVTCHKLCDISMRCGMLDDATKYLDSVQSGMDSLLRVVDKPWRLMSWLSTLLRGFIALMDRYHINSLGNGFDKALYTEDVLRMVLRRMEAMPADCGTGDPNIQLFATVQDFFPGTHLTVPPFAGGRPLLVTTATGYLQLENQANALELVRQHEDTKERHTPLHQQASELLTQCLAAVPASQNRRRAHLTALVGDRLRAAGDFSRATQCYLQVLHVAGADVGWLELVQDNARHLRVCAQESCAWGHYALATLLELGWLSHASEVTGGPGSSYFEAQRQSLTEEFYSALSELPGTASALLGLTIDAGMAPNADNPMESVASGRRCVRVSDAHKSPIEIEVTYNKQTFVLGESVHVVLRLRNRLGRTLVVPPPKDSAGTGTGTGTTTGTGTGGVRVCFSHGIAADVVLGASGLTLPPDEWVSVSVSITPPGEVVSASSDTDVEVPLYLEALEVSEELPVGGMVVKWDVSMLSMRFIDVLAHGTLPLDALNLCPAAECPAHILVKKQKSGLTLRDPHLGTGESRKVFAGVVQRVDLVFDTNDDVLREGRLQLATDVLPGGATMAVFWQPTDAAGSSFQPLTLHASDCEDASLAGQPACVLILPELEKHTSFTVPVYIRLMVTGEIRLSCSVSYIARPGLPVGAPSSLVTTTLSAPVLVVKPLRFLFHTFPDNEFPSGVVGAGGGGGGAQPLLLAGQSASLQVSVTFLGQGFGCASMGKVELTGISFKRAAAPEFQGVPRVVSLVDKAMTSGVVLGEAEAVTFETRFACADPNTVLLHPSSVDESVSESPGELVVMWCPAAATLMDAPEVILSTGTSASTSTSTSSGVLPLWLPPLETSVPGQLPLDSKVVIGSHGENIIQLPWVKVVAAPFRVVVDMPTVGVKGTPFDVHITVHSALPTSSCLDLSAEPCRGLVQLGWTRTQMQVGPYGSVSVVLSYVPTVVGEVAVPIISLHSTAHGNAEVLCLGPRFKQPRVLVAAAEAETPVRQSQLQQ
jgi:hypothetical protein